MRHGRAWDSGDPVIVKRGAAADDALVALGSSGVAYADPLFADARSERMLTFTAFEVAVIVALLTHSFIMCAACSCSSSHGVYYKHGL